MPTSNDSPTAGELNTPTTASGNTVPQDLAEPEETNFPATPASVEELPEVPTAAEAAEMEVISKAEEGDIYATYVGQQPSHRILSVDDLRSLGDKEATEPMVWDSSNRFVRNVTDAHPLVIRYLDQTDPGFKVEHF
jgi:hypothetical protein